jgi:hypothetical protein
MAWYIDENEKVHEFKMHSRDSIILKNGTVVPDTPTTSRRMFALPPEEHPRLKFTMGKWYYEGKPLNGGDDGP